MTTEPVQDTGIRQGAQSVTERVESWINDQIVASINSAMDSYPWLQPRIEAYRPAAIHNGGHAQRLITIRGRTQVLEIMIVVSTKTHSPWRAEITVFRGTKGESGSTPPVMILDFTSENIPATLGHRLDSHIHSFFTTAR